MKTKAGSALSGELAVTPTQPRESGHWCGRRRGPRVPARPWHCPLHSGEGAWLLPGGVAVGPEGAGGQGRPVRTAAGRAGSRRLGTGRQLWSRAPRLLNAARRHSSPLQRGRRSPPSSLHCRERNSERFEWSRGRGSPRTAGELGPVGGRVTLDMLLPLSGLSFPVSRKELALGCSLQL